MKEFGFEDLIQDFFINLNNVISTTRSCPIYFQKFPPRILSQYYCHPVKSAANYYYAYWLKLSKKRSVGGNILQKRKKRSKKNLSKVTGKTVQFFLLTNKINMASSCLQGPEVPRKTTE